MNFFEDTAAPFEAVRHHGYYVVGEKFYLYRYNAFLEASRLGTDFKWVFNNDVYEKLDWSKPIDKSLQQLYKERAQQLRDKYNYLILAYSGGSDSHNILTTFIKNKIKLDEIWIDWPHGLMDKVGFKPTMKLGHDNLASEWHFNIQAKLQDVATFHPEIKIHISDSASKGTVEDYEDTSRIVGFRTSYQNITRMRYISHYQRKLYDKGLNVALITGIEKPSIGITPDDRLCVTLHDLPTAFKNDITPNRRTVIEYFYWTPDSPFMVVNQAHALLRYFQRNIGEFKQVEDQMRTGKHNIDRSKNLNAQINKVCYPEWDECFQTNKFLYTFENNQFNSLLLPFIQRGERFAKIYHHRYFADSKNIRDDLLYHPTTRLKMKAVWRSFPIMSLETFYKGVINV